jgi:hypothetical protein
MRQNLVCELRVQEVSMLRSPLTLPGDRVAVGGPGGLLLHSAATDHYPQVRLEFWDGPPSAEPGSWGHVLELNCEVQSPVRLQPVTADHSDHTLPIPHPGDYHARVHVGHQNEAAELDEGTLGSGVEHWLIQLWPA